MAPRRSQSFSSGDVFRIQLLDGSCALGQIIEVTKQAMNSVLCGFYDVRAAETEIDRTEIFRRNLISVQFVTPESLKRSSWPVVRHEAVPFDPNEFIPFDELAEKGFVGARIVGSGIMKEFMNAYFGLKPWDDWHDPTFLDSLLAPGAKRPSAIVLTKKL